MAQLRIIRPTKFKFGMAYCDGARFVSGEESLRSEVVSRMAAALETEYVSKSKLFLRIVPNAFVGSQRAALMQSVFCGFEQERSYRKYLSNVSLGSFP